MSDALSEANDLVNALSRAEILENIEKILTEHPDGKYLFVSISQEEKDGESWYLMQTDSSTDEIDTQLYIAQSFIHNLLRAAWPDDDD